MERKSVEEQGTCVQRAQPEERPGGVHGEQSGGKRGTLETEAVGWAVSGGAVRPQELW